MSRSLRKLAAGLALALLAAEAHAGLVVNNGIIGNWSCKIDGRDSRMVWQVVDASTTKCSNGVCSKTSGVAIRGWFKDGAGPWVKLSNLKQGSSAVTFRHADGNLWKLTLSGNYAYGHTTWHGKKYPLSCTRA